MKRARNPTNAKSWVSLHNVMAAFVLLPAQPNLQKWMRRFDRPVLTRSYFKIHQIHAKLSAWEADMN
jgi:hypothetical protein